MSQYYATFVLVPINTIILIFFHIYYIHLSVCKQLLIDVLALAIWFCFIVFINYFLNYFESRYELLWWYFSCVNIMLLLFLFFSYFLVLKWEICGPFLLFYLWKKLHLKIIIECFEKKTCQRCRGTIYKNVAIIYSPNYSSFILLGLSVQLFPWRC